MKKGFILALGTIIIAMAGSSFATTPTIGGIPDVVITDGDENAGLTVDLNFFRYISAFNILDYASDEDTATTALQFAFAEPNDRQNIQINGKPGLTQAEVAAPVPSDWTGLGKELADGTGAKMYWWNFRDILRTPAGSDPTEAAPDPNPLRADGSEVASDVTELLPWENTDGSSDLSGDSRNIMILVGDEADNVATDVIAVYSQNNGTKDMLSGTFTTLFTDDTFTGWVWGSEGVPAAVATSSSLTGTAGGNTFIGLSGGLTATTGSLPLYFSRWREDSPNFTGPIPVVDATNEIYCAKLTMEIAAAPSTKGRVPQIRIGVENTVQNMVLFNLIGAGNLSNVDSVPDSENEHLPAVGTERTYTVYWSSNTQAPESDMVDTRAGVVGVDWGRFRLFFDMLDANKDTTQGFKETEGTWQINYVEVGTLNRPESVSPITISDLSAANGFASEAVTTGSSVVENADGSITFNMGASSGSFQYALWRKGGAVNWVGGKIIRCAAYLSVPTAAARATFPTARIRHNTIGGWFDQVWIVLELQGAHDIGDGTHYPLVPDTTPTPYETYVPTYGGPWAYVLNTVVPIVDPNADKLTLGLDSVASSATAAATQWSVSQVVYDVLDDPLDLN